jgi:hypothetical protein
LSFYCQALSTDGFTNTKIRTPQSTRNTIKNITQPTARAGTRLLLSHDVVVGETKGLFKGLSY